MNILREIRNIDRSLEEGRISFQEAADRVEPFKDAEPVRHGQWIGIEYDGYADGNPVYDLWECSNCNCEWDGEEDTLPNYCPDCGAKMDRGER